MTNPTLHPWRVVFIPRLKGLLAFGISTGQARDYLGFRLNILRLTKTDKENWLEKEMRDIVSSKTEREHMRVKIQNGNAFWNEIGVNADVSKLMLLSLNLLLPVLVYAARHSLTAVRHKLMLPGITSYCWVS
ncbi:hypothetical protein Tco_0778319 [Tanacetum coccineum]